MNNYDCVRPAPPPDVLSQISLLAAEMVDLSKTTIPELEAQLSVAKARQATIEERLLPDMFDQVGLKEVVTDKGVRVVLKENIRASLSADRKPGAIEWLEKNGYSGMVTNEVVVGFPKSREGDARELLRDLAPKFGNTKICQDVNTGSVKALIMERLKAGLPTPLEVFGATKFRIAKLESK